MLKEWRDDDIRLDDEATTPWQYPRIDCSDEEHTVLRELGAAFDVNAFHIRDIPTQIILRLIDFINEPCDTAMQQVRRLYLARLVLRKVVPIYPQLEELRDITERAMRRIGQFAKRELKRRKTP